MHDLADGLAIGDDRHPGTRHFAKLFAFRHLPDHLQEISSEVAQVAQFMVESLPDGPELSTGLRWLLQAKDCFVRAQLG